MTPVKEESIGSVSYPFYDKKRNCIYVAVNNNGRVPHIASLDLSTGKMDRLTDVKGAALFYVTSLIYDESSDRIFYTSDNDRWRDLNSYNLTTGETKQLQKDFRTGDLAFNKADKSIWGIKHLNGFSTIVRVEQFPPEDMQGNAVSEYGDWDQMYTLPYGQDIFDIDVSPDGKILSAAVTDLSGNQSLIFYDTEQLREGNSEGDTIFNFQVASPQSFRFTDDGKYLYGTSYYTGVSNVFRVLVETGDIDIMSNAVTGLFRPTLLDEERIFAFNFKSDGFQPVIIPNETVETVSNISFLGNVTVEKYPELGEWQIPILRESDLDMSTLITKEGKYKAGKEMELKYAYPIVVGYKNNVGLGYRMSISDPFNFKKLDMSISFTPREWTNSLLADRAENFTTLDDEELVHFDFNYSFSNISISGSFNRAAFHDLFGPSQSSRKGARLGISYNKSLLYDPPRTLNWNASLSGFYGLDQSPEFQQIVLTGVDNNLFFNLTSSLSWSSVKGSIGAVDAEKGIQATLWGSLATSAGNFFPRLLGLVNYGMPLPGKHFSLWLRGSAGTSTSDIFNAFTRFGFGAFGNNYVDHGSAKQYRGPFAFPGVRFDSDRSIIGQRFAKGMAELVFPALRFRKVGGFNFFANWIQPTVFGSIVTTRDAQEFIPDRDMYNLGAQIDLRMVTFSLLPSTLSIGYAKAWDIDGDESFNEFMISLKLLH